MGETLINTSPSLSEDEFVLSLIATGLVRLHEEISSGNPLRYPYPTPLQRGLDRLTVLKLKRDEKSPQSIPNLLQWCQKNLREWSLQLPPDSIGENDRLLDGHILTNLCESWACANTDVEAELSEQRFMETLFDICQAHNGEFLYTAVRELLITKPVLTALEFQQVQIEPDYEPVEHHIQIAYQAAPQSALLNGEYHCCAHCGNLLLRTANDQMICENERCQTMGIEVSRVLSDREQPYWLRRGLRRFVAAPGVAEIQLADELKSRGLKVDLWPAYDRYDLRIYLPDAKIWAVDVKDWANPFILAHNVKPIPKHPEWHRAFFVFPDARQKQRRDYMRAFRNNTDVLDGQTNALFVWQFLRQIDEYIGGLN